MRKILKAILSSLIPAPWDVYSWLGYLIPIVVSGATIATGYLDGQPWMWIIMAASLALAGMAVTNVALSSWWRINQIAGKVAFVRARSSKLHNENAICLGLEMKNNSHRELLFILDKYTARFGDRVPVDDYNLGQVFEAPPYGIFWYDGPKIAYDPIANGTINGLITYEGRYGRKGKLVHKFSGSKNIHVGFNKDGEIIAGNWTEAALLPDS